MKVDLLTEQRVESVELNRKTSLIPRGGDVGGSVVDGCAAFGWLNRLATMYFIRSHRRREATGKVAVVFDCWGFRFRK